MSRKTVVRDLPPLRDVLPEFQGFTPETNQHHLMEALLLKAAYRLRRRARRPFYAMRETAQFFGVSVRTASRVYQRLQHQGVLVCTRSSMTLLHPRRAAPRVAVRGVVGLPVWYPGFMLFHEWRRFFLNLEEELRLRRFAGDLIFYGQGEEVEPDFVARVLARSPDFVFWFCPSPADEAPLLLLRDAGVPLVLLSNQPKTPAGRYRLCLRAALRQGLATWKARGIRQLELVEQAPLGLIPEWRRSVLDEAGIPYRVVPCAAQNPARFLRSLGTQPDTGVLFLEDMLQSYLWRVAPEAVAALAGRATVMIEKNLPLYPATRSGVAFDVLQMNWRRVATAIARDFDRETVLTQHPPTTLEASWRPHVDMASLGRELDGLYEPGEVRSVRPRR